MANGPRFVAVLADESGFSTAALDKLAWPMRKAGLLSRSGRGHASDRIHHDHWHAAHWVLALAAQGPTTVVDTVLQLGALEWTHPEPGDFGDLLHVVAAEIGARASHIFNGRPPTGPHDAPDWQLTLCLDPLSAWMEWSENGEPRRRDFVPPNVKQKRTRSVRRLTVIDRDVLNAVAELCADSLAHAAAQTETAAFAEAAAPRSRGVTTTPPSVDTRRDTGNSDCRQDRTTRAPEKHRKIRSDRERLDPLTGLGA